MQFKVSTRRLYKAVINRRVDTGNRHEYQWLIDILETDIDDVDAIQSVILNDNEIRVFGEYL